MFGRRREAEMKDLRKRLMKAPSLYGIVLSGHLYVVAGEGPERTVIVIYLGDRTPERALEDLLGQKNPVAWVRKSPVVWVREEELREWLGDSYRLVGSSDDPSEAVIEAFLADGDPVANLLRMAGGRA